MAMLKDANYRKCIECGDSARISVLISMCYLLNSVSNAYFEQAVEIMEKYNILHKKLKTKTNNLYQSFESFDKEFASLIDAELRKDLCDDFEQVQNFCDKFMNMDAAVNNHLAKMQEITNGNGGMEQ